MTWRTEQKPQRRHSWSTDALLVLGLLCFAYLGYHYRYELSLCAQFLGERLANTPAAATAHKIREADPLSTLRRLFVRRPASGGQTYVVQPGDSLSGIAARFGVSSQALIAANKDRYPSLATDPGLLQAGWELRIPAAGAARAPAPEIALAAPTPFLLLARQEAGDSCLRQMHALEGVG
jgi:hypothetical protein